MGNKVYKLEDIISFSVHIEEQGEKFYQAVSDYAEKKDIKDIFLRLNEAEVEHRKIFLKFHDICSKEKMSFPAGEDFEELLGVLARGTLFPDISEVRDSLNGKGKDNISAVIKLAMDIETNTILFYQEIAGLVKSDQVEKVLVKIVSEEKRHLVMLKNLRMDIDPLYAGLNYGNFF